MKKCILALTVVFSVYSYSQKTQLERVSNESCKCIKNIRIDIKEKKKFKEIKECITSANLSIQLLDGLGIEKKLDSVVSNNAQIDSVFVDGDREIIIDVDKDYREIEEYLLRNCEAMKTLMASRDLETRNSVSNRKKARKDYDRGQAFFSQGKYAIAIEHYKNAVNKDSKFAFAWDMIGYSYRKLGEYDRAIENYKKSLEIDPKGKMPLINIAYAYEFKEEYDNAISAMNNYIRIYPKEAEGYYGRGRLFHLKGDYENALDDTMNAYLKYIDAGSPYARDAEKNLGMFYNELEEAGKIDLFEKIAKKYNIKITE